MSLVVPHVRPVGRGLPSVSRVICSGAERRIGLVECGVRERPSRSISSLTETQRLAELSSRHLVCTNAEEASVDGRGETIDETERKRQRPRSRGLIDF